MAIPDEELTEKITKVGENNVIVEKMVTLADGKTFSVGEAESYGQERIDRESTMIDTQLSYWQNSSKATDYVNNQIATLQKMSTRLDAIKTEMQKKLEVPQ